MKPSKYSFQYRYNDIRDDAKDSICFLMNSSDIPEGWDINKVIEFINKMEIWSLKFTKEEEKYEDSD